MFIFDLHSHFSFKPANSRNFFSHDLPDSDHWRERVRLKNQFSGLISWLDKTVVKTSQLHGNSATNGGFRVICNGLYPLERGFMPGALIKEVATLTGHAKEEISKMKNCDISYFEVLQREYTNLENNQTTAGAAIGNKYQLVDSFNDIVGEIKSDSDTICILNSVEGMHAFADDFFASNGAYLNMHHLEKVHLRAENPDPHSFFMLYLRSIQDNINTVKTTWNHTPFFVTFSHHYYNHVAGHAPSLGGFVKTVASQRGSTVIENHSTTAHDEIQYFFLGIRSWGKFMIRKLLDNKQTTNTNTRRILVDVKHMSPQARVDYYQFLQSDPRYAQVPIIMSHTGISGRKNIQRTINNNHKLHNDEKTPSQYFFEGVINIFDDEIITIVNSDGLIGLMIDERRIMGKKIPPEGGMSLKTFKKVSKQARKLIAEMNLLKHRLAWREISQASFNQDYPIAESAFNNIVDLLKKVYLSVIFRQIFHATDVAGKKVLDHLALGTDYDGVINPIDIYLQASDMASLATDLEKYWKTCCNSADASVKKLYTDHKFGRSPKHWIQKILVLNGTNFLKKYFNDEYLLNGNLSSKGWVLTKAEEELFVL